jgi:predicted transcriptional regulator
MSKAVMLSVRPKWCDKIANGEKTIEVRKTRPKLETPFKCYIYCTRDKHLAFMQNQMGTNLIACMDVDAAIPVGGAIGNGKVIGEFTCDRIYKIDKDSTDFLFKAGGLSVYMQAAEEKCGLRVAMTDDELHGYLGHRQGYGWHISDLKIYDAPKKLGEFWRDCLEYSELSTNCWSCENVCGDGDETDCNTDGRLYLHRPPQSWCYVDDVQAK